jgi:hypothetical protein
VKPARRLTVRVAAGLVLAAGLALASNSAGADRVYPKKGPAVRGFVSRTDTDVVVNPYRAKSPQMTYGLKRFPIDQVKRVDEESIPAEIVRRRREDLDPKDVEGRVGLAKYAISQSLVREANRVLEEALALSPTHAEALKLYGGEAKYQAFVRSNPQCVPSSRKLLDELLMVPKAEREAGAFARYLDTHKMSIDIPPRETLGRAYTSAKASKGFRKDEPLRLRADKSPGATYSLFVPEGYDSWTPLPLLVALHDGGRGGKDGTSVNGSGRDAVTLYLEGAQNRGWIVVCPTAVAAPWTAPANEPLVLAVLDEVCARWNVDLDRVFLVGHGMGADGALAIGAKHLDLFAGLGASSGEAPAAPKGVKAAGTTVFLYHAADDPATAVGVTRTVADQLLAADADVVYLELPNLGHSFPTEGQKEMYDTFRGKRLADSKRPTDWPRASFLRKPMPDEIRDLGDPSAAWSK